jgi:pimeloyl-ACP methyl ester carboxylesterase
MVGQMYVEYLMPQNVTRPYPIMMIHGTAQTGTNFMGTPDGRPGWAHNFLARGYRVYVVDQVGRGRSGADPQVYGP